MFIFPLIWLVCAFGAMAIANSKGRSGCLYAIVGFFLGPIGLLIAIGMAPEDPIKRGLRTREYLPCPDCGEATRREASVCRFCGRKLVPLPPL